MTSHVLNFLRNHGTRSAPMTARIPTTICHRNFAPMAYSSIAKIPYLSNAGHSGHSNARHSGHSNARHSGHSNARHSGHSNAGHSWRTHEKRNDPHRRSYVPTIFRTAGHAPFPGESAR
jgi:hypothetical protein